MAEVFISDGCSLSGGGEVAQGDASEFFISYQKIIVPSNLDVPKMRFERPCFALIGVSWVPPKLSQTMIYIDPRTISTHRDIVAQYLLFSCDLKTHTSFTLAAP